jgi:chemotaxis protein methyltransferase CheR
MPSPDATLPDRTATPGATGEFAFGDADFQRVRHLIRARAGIHLQHGKHAMVYSRLARRVRETGHACIGAYLRDLENASGPQAHSEWQAFVNCLTTNLTSFFRENHHFDELARALATRRGEALRIWCTAASTGEEPYSIAMVAHEVLGAQANVQIIASDIDTGVLAHARRGVYPIDARGLSEARRRAHCLRGTGANAGSLRIRPDLARRIEFAGFNLMEADYRKIGGPFDYVFCRNVMIYFDAAVQRQVLARLHATTKQGGWLFVGHSENFTDARGQFRLLGQTIYERL